MSGYAEEIIKKMGLINSVATYISKPVLPINLLKKMREVLDTQR